jgi:hypothetical protein
MHQLGLLSSDEKSLMKDLILSRNPKFKDEFAHAERTNNWQQLSAFLRSQRLTRKPVDTVDSLVSEFEGIHPPSSSAPKKRAAASSFGRPKKNTVSSAAASPATPSSSQTLRAGGEEEMDDSVSKLKKNERERRSR